MSTSDLPSSMRDVLERVAAGMTTETDAEHLQEWLAQPTLREQIVVAYLTLTHHTEAAKMWLSPEDRWKAANCLVNDTPLGSVMGAIWGEILHQNNKYGMPGDRNLSDWSYAGIMRDEMTETMQAIAGGDDELARLEALQAITVGIQWLMRHGVVTREMAGES